MARQAFYPEHDADLIIKIGSRSITPISVTDYMNAHTSSMVWEPPYLSGYDIPCTIDDSPAVDMKYQRADLTTYTQTSESFTTGHPPHPRPTK